MTVNRLATLGGIFAGIGFALLGYCIGNLDDFEEEETPQVGFYPRPAEETDEETPNSAQKGARRSNHGR